MLKRLLFAAALAASTLVVTGAAEASSPSVCASAGHRAPSSSDLCKWRDDGCYYCYSYRTARWDQQYCGGGDDSGDSGDGE
ncbi:hypothetical protein ABZU32_39325 [Sphaerisporangium sp. NPDC005288]|uniref:Uncharacterized protein n=1 Tax=Sphaerisporangium rhizosphaerae TaxID=2269375 RepID=A0ABW2P5V8_9ACTN